MRSHRGRCFCWLLALLLGCGSPALFAEDPKPDTLRVAVYDDEGAGRSLARLVDVLEQFEDVEFERLSAAEIREGKLHGFDVLVHPGGSASRQASTLGEEGRERVRAFVEQGGGYVGFCAGAYLASADYGWSLGILDAKVLDRKHWNRGFGNVRVQLTVAGRRALGTDQEAVTIYYYQGPLLAPAGNPHIPDYQVLGTFQTEIAENGAPRGVMKGTTAVASATFGKGRVFCFSPHPERTKGLERFVYRAVRWAATGE